MNTELPGQKYILEKVYVLWVHEYTNMLLCMFYTHGLARKTVRLTCFCLLKQTVLNPLFWCRTGSRNCFKMLSGACTNTNSWYTIKIAMANSPVHAFQTTLSIRLSCFTHFIPQSTVTVSKAPSKHGQQVKTCIHLTEPGLVQTQDVKTADFKPAAMHLAVMQRSESRADPA